MSLGERLRGPIVSACHHSKRKDFFDKEGQSVSTGVVRGVLLALKRCNSVKIRCELQKVHTAPLKNFNEHSHAFGPGALLLPRNV